MNYIKHLSGFFDKVAKDERLNPTHVSLYVSLFQFWNACRFHNPISISRNEVMKVSKISSKATYHKCIRELNDFGYLNYSPSYNPFKGSLVYLYDFQASAEQAKASNHTKNRTGAEQALAPYINTTNKNKLQTKANGHENIHSHPVSEHSLFKGSEATEKSGTADTGAKKEKLREKKKGEAGGGEPGGTGAGFKRPLLQDVKGYFGTKGWPTIEAEKFFNHYQSNGWLVGGKTPMRDWKASAGNWNINSGLFKGQGSAGPGSVHVNNNKDYSEPL